MKLDIRFTVEVSDTDIDDIMAIVLENDITADWVERVIPDGKYLGEYASDQISRGGNLLFYEIGEKKPRVLTPEKFKQGLFQFILEESNRVLIVNDDAPFIRQLDTCEIDAYDADRILQYSLFGGHCVYG